MTFTMIIFKSQRLTTHLTIRSACGMDWMVELWRFFAYIVSLATVVGVVTAPLSKRIKQLEIDKSKNPKRTINDCSELMTRCPTQAKISLFGGVLDEIKNDIKEIRRDVQEHIKFHLKGINNNE